VPKRVPARSPCERQSGRRLDTSYIIRSDTLFSTSAPTQVTVPALLASRWSCVSRRERKGGGHVREMAQRVRTSRKLHACFAAIYNKRGRQRGRDPTPLKPFLTLKPYTGGKGTSGGAAGAQMAGCPPEHTDCSVRTGWVGGLGAGGALTATRGAPDGGGARTRPARRSLPG
jgi:hypothetical protein